jgi:hypothetical protein
MPCFSVGAYVYWHCVVERYKLAEITNKSVRNIMYDPGVERLRVRCSPARIQKLQPCKRSARMHTLLATIFCIWSTLTVLRVSFVHPDDTNRVILFLSSYEMLISSSWTLLPKWPGVRE